MICFVLPDGTHIRGCDRHRGEHPYDVCQQQFEERWRKIKEHEQAIVALRAEAQAAGDLL